MNVPINVDDLGRGPLILGLTWTFSIIAILFVSFRFYVRCKLSTGLAVEDWLMCAAVISSTVSQIFVTIAYHYGFGKHDTSLSPNQLINILKWIWIANTPGLVVSILARISIAILLVRLFGIHLWFKWFLIVVTGLCTILTIVILPSTYLQSTPISANWNPFIPAKHWDPIIYITIAYLTQALWSFTDLTFVLFPVLIIWKLQMGLGQRIGLVVLMSASLFTLALSILKTIGLSEIAHQQADPNAVDAQYNAALEILWSLLEQAFVIIMGCVPPLRAAARLDFAKSISASLASILRPGGSTQASSRDHQYENSGGPYDKLKVSTEMLGRARKDFRPPFAAAATYEEAYDTSQRNLLEGDAIRATTETRVSFTQGGHNV